MSRGTPIRYTQFDGLLNVGVSDFLLQDNELTACKNVWVYKLGKLQKVPGYSLSVNSQIVDGEDVSYLHHYYDTSSSTNYLLATSDTGSNLTLKYRTTGNFATISGISTSWDTYATSKPSMVNYLGKTFIVGHKTGTTFLPNATITGTTFSTSDSNITDMPQGKFIVRYKDLIYVLYAKVDGTTYPSRAYYCDEPTAGAITWNNTLTKWEEFGYDDGDEITGGAEALDRLIVFKKHSMWRYDESVKVKIDDVGCNSHRSIVNINGVLYWTNRKGVWRWTGGMPQLISAKAQELFDAVDQTTLENQIGACYNESEYRVFLGDITMNDYEYKNTWFCWDTIRERAYIRCTYDDVKSACNYIEDGKYRTYFSNDDGYVMKFATPVDKVYSDNNNEIDSFFVTKALDHGVPEDVKFTTYMSIFSNYATGMKCAVQKDNDKAFREANISILKNNIEKRDLSGSANRFRYKFYEKGKGKSWEFEGFVIQTQIKQTE
jgi:hypothetical protein